VISPPPSPGQEVVIVQCSEDAATRGCPDPAEPVEVLRYVAAADDVEAPPVGGAVTISHTYGPAEVACMEEGDVGFHVDVTGLDQGSETDVLYVVVLDTGHPEGYSDPQRTQWVGPAATGSLTFEFGDHLDLATIPPEDACVTVTAMDLAGHITTIAETCGSTPTNAPPSTGDDSSDGGGDSSSDGDDAADVGTTDGEPPIDPSTSGTEADDTGGVDLEHELGDRGCACAVDRQSGPGLLALFGLVLLARRRERPRCPRG
jgi:MYXO-CTERM domain-containing protein